MYIVSCFIDHVVSEEARRAPEEFVAEDVPENHVVSDDVGMLTGVTERDVPGSFVTVLVMSPLPYPLPDWYWAKPLLLKAEAMEILRFLPGRHLFKCIG